MLPKNFCVLPFLHVVLNPYDSLQHKTTALPCCRYTHQGTEYYEDVDPINKATTWIELQNKFLNDEKPEGCSHCWRDEQHKIKSYRQIMLGDFANEIANESFKEKKLRFLELMFGNTCNLSCRSCGPTFSSKWVPIYSHLEKKYNISAETHTPNIKFSDWKNLDLRYLTHLKIMGGEPFYQKGALELLEYLSEIDVLKNISLSIPTNCTMPLNSKWKELLLEAKKVHIGISIDGVGPINDYLREGSNWLEIEENLYSFHELAKSTIRKITLTFNTVVTVYNVNLLFDVQQYFKKRFFWKHDFDIAYYPKYLDVALLPDSIKDKLLKLYLPEKVLTYLTSKQPSTESFDKLKFMTKTLDKYHNKNFIEYNPQMYNWIFNE